MIPVSSASRFFLYNHPTDMRKSFDGLCGLVNNELKGNPLSGDVYLFINRRRDRMKLLVWDKSGFWLLYKRLESGRFQMFSNAKVNNSIEVSYETLVMLIEGVDIQSLRRKKRYGRPKLLALNS